AHDMQTRACREGRRQRQRIIDRAFRERAMLEAEQSILISLCEKAPGAALDQLAESAHRAGSRSVDENQQGARPGRRLQATVSWCAGIVRRDGTPCPAIQTRRACQAVL